MVDGLMLPTSKSYVDGAGNPRDSAIASQQLMNSKQQALNASVGGKMYHKRSRRVSRCKRTSCKRTSCKRRKRSNKRSNKRSSRRTRYKRRKRSSFRGGVINVPQFQMQYDPQGGVGTNPNDQVANLTQTSTQAAAWSKYDNRV